MTKKLALLFLFFLLSIPLCVFPQQSRQQLLDQLFGSWGEIYFKFHIQEREDLLTLTKIISIDNVTGDEVYAYANRKEFSEFLDRHAEYTLLPHPGTLLGPKELEPAGPQDGPLTTWNFYPTYQQYLDYMYGFAASYPSICKVINIGTSVQGRELLAVKISDNVNEEDPEPQFLYCSSIHGDETTGYVLMMHLIDYLLTNYGTDPRITNIVDNTEIFINPLHNPDGTYHGGNNNIYGATRYNANNVDLNRNFPDPADGPHPDGLSWQPETVAFMAFADSNHFVIGGNFHGGSEVFNYPWDTWAKLTADDDWWQFIGHEYVDTVHQYSPSSYFSGFDNGISNGYAWYRITGGRQDYMNYWHSDREVTLEISNVKLLPTSQLLTFWNYNYHSFLNHIEEANYGVQGIVTDSLTGEPLNAKAYIFGFDKDNSEVYSKLPSGYYSRLLIEGTYNISFTCPGYFSKLIQNITVQNRVRYPLDVPLVPLNIGIADAGVERRAMVFPNPSDGIVKIMLPTLSDKSSRVSVMNTLGQVVYTGTFTESRPTATADLSGNAPGFYVVRVNSSVGVFEDRLILK